MRFEILNYHFDFLIFEFCIFFIMEFPIFKTKIKGVTRRFNLTDPAEQREYFRQKAGKEIEGLRRYLKDNTFVAYLLGKKNSGKGTYAKMFAEAVSPERIEHFSVGDMVRALDKQWADPEKRKDLLEFLKKNYRGRFSLEEIVSSFEKRSTKTLLPTELILTLIKREIGKKKKKALFIDGFPRDMDQMNFSLFFRDLIDYRADPDVFVLIDVPEIVIDQRIKWRRVCPVCQTSRNLKLLPTSRVGFDKEKKEFYLICDNPRCKGARLVSKEGDELGTKPLKERFEKDDKLLKMAFSLHGVPKVLLRNTLPLQKAKEFVDDYEITPEYVFHWKEKENKVEIEEKPWTFPVDGQLSVSLLPQPVVVSLIKQMAGIFLKKF